MNKAGVFIKKFAKKKDILIASLILISAFILAIIFWFSPFEGQLYACIYIDGEFIESIPLQEELLQEEIKTQYGTNVLMILDNKVYIKESDCTYQQCVNSGSISRPAQAIVCAPHSLVITIEDAESVGRHR